MLLTVRGSGFYTWVTNTVTDSGSRDSLLVRLERRTHDWKVASLNPGSRGGRIFLSRVNFVCWLLLDVLSFPMLPQWHVKDPGHSAKSAGGRLHLNTHSPLTSSWNLSNSFVDLAYNSCFEYTISGMLFKKKNFKSCLIDVCFLQLFF